MEEVSQDQPVKMSRRKSWTIRLALWSFVVTFFGALTGLITLLEAPLRLFFGWAVHAWVTLPPLLPRWKELLLPLAAAGLALWMADRFIRWALAAKRSELRWQGRHTLSATFLLLLGSAAAIAMSGIVHQVAWLGGETWWAGGRPVIQRTVAMANARQILLALEDFEEKNGRYPDSLAELDLPSSLRVLPPRQNGLPEPFVYLKPKDPLPEGDEQVVIVSPVLPDLDKVCVGYLSGTVASLQAAELSKLLDASRSQTSPDHD